MADTNKFVDYDAAFAEQEEARKPLIRRLFGRDWELPAVPPAAVLIRLSRLVADGRSEEDITGGEAMLLAADLIPAPILDAWLDLGLDIDQLPLILQDLLDEYGPALSGGDGAGDDPEPEAPTTGAQPVPVSPTSSPGGAFSKPIFNASTRLTSAGG